MKWFGEPWPSEEMRAPVCEDDALRVTAPPEGEECIFCGKGFGAGDQGVLMPHITENLLLTEHYIHLDCLIGNVGGGL